MNDRSARVPHSNFSRKLCCNPLSCMVFQHLTWHEKKKGRWNHEAVEEEYSIYHLEEQRKKKVWGDVQNVTILAAKLQSLLVVKNEYEKNRHTSNLFNALHYVEIYWRILGSLPEMFALQAKSECECQGFQLLSCSTQIEGRHASLSRISSYLSKTLNYRAWCIDNK